MVFLRLTLLAVIAAWGLPALAAAPSETLPPQTPSHQTVPEASGGSAGPLGDKLDRSGGVIRPPVGIDPDIAHAPPPSGDRSPVIAPPGTAGKDAVNPK